jgi:hypothetical protein
MISVKDCLAHDKPAVVSTGINLLTCPPTLIACRLINDIIADLPEGVPDEAKNYVRKMCDYTCRGRDESRDGVYVRAFPGPERIARGCVPFDRSYLEVVCVVHKKKKLGFQFHRVSKKAHITA